MNRTVRRLSTALPSILLAIFTLSATAAQESFVGRVVGLADGDTISVMRDGRAVSVRLEGVDAPERGQPFGTRAKQELSDLVYAKDVLVDVRDHDRYGRIVGRVFVDSIDVSLYMVSGGMAWHFKRYSSEAVLADAENRARIERRGLWNDPTSVAPWEWRRPAAASSSPAPASAPLSLVSSSAGQECGSKRFCREMTSCAEARHHLKACGVSSLDGDGDGVPCEMLCQ